MAAIKIRLDADTAAAGAKVDALYRKISKVPGSAPTGQQQLQAIMGDMLRAKQALYASFGGKEFPIDKPVQKFGAVLKQARQGMGELTVANRAMVRGMASELKSFDWNTLHTAQQFVRPGATEATLRSGTKRALAMGPLNPQAFNWKQAGLGAMVSPFSPWLGARAISGAFGGARGGGPGGGGITAAIFGAGGMGRFILAFTAIHVVVEGLKFAFMELHKAITDTAKLYQESASTATAPGALFQIQSAFKAIGMTPNAAEVLRIRGEHPLRGGAGPTMRFPGTDIILGAGRGTRQVGELQQIKNMSEYIERAWKESAMNARQMEAAVKPLQDTQFELVSLTREWHTLWSQMSAQMSPIIVTLLKSAEGWLKFFNSYLEGQILIQQYLGILPKDKAPGKEVFANKAQTSGHISAWEKMGFVIGGTGGNDHAKKTAENTGKTVQKLDELLKAIMPQAISAGYSNFYP